MWETCSRVTTLSDSLLVGLCEERMGPVQSLMLWIGYRCLKKKKRFLGFSTSLSENHQKLSPFFFFFGSSARCPGVIGIEDAEFLTIQQSY